MNARAFFKKYLWDIIVVGSLALVSSAAAIYIAIPKNDNAHIAKIYCNAIQIQNDIDLSKEADSVRTFTIQGAVSGDAGKMVIGVKKNAICVVSSFCPNHYCIQAGWVSDSAHPIVCAYNHVTITIVASGVNAQV